MFKLLKLAVSSFKLLANSLQFYHLYYFFMFLMKGKPFLPSHIVFSIASAMLVF